MFGYGANPMNQNPQIVIPQITIPNSLHQQMNIQPVTQITVKGEEAARNYKFPPNSRGAIFDEEKPVFYFKETDSSGNEIAFKICSYSEVIEPPKPEYLTVQEFRSAIADLEKRLKEGSINE